MIERAKTQVQVIEREVTPHITSSLSHVVWGAIFAGAVIVMVSQLVLSLLGAGIGLSAIDTAQAESARTVGIGAMIWWVLSGIAAFYAGGWVAGRLSGFPWRTDGILHGLLTWGVTTLFLFLFLTSTIGALIGGGFGMLSSKQSQQQNSQQQGSQSAGGQGGMSAIMPQISQNIPAAGAMQDIQNDIQQLLNQRGVPPENIQNVQAQLMTAIGALALQDDPQAQESQRQQIVNILTTNVNMPPDEARTYVDRWTQNTQVIKQDVQQGVERASDAAGKGALLSFAMLFLGALAAGFGGWMGAAHWSSEEAIV